MPKTPLGLVPKSRPLGKDRAQARLARRMRDDSNNRVLNSASSIVPGKSLMQRQRRWRPSVKCSGDFRLAHFASSATSAGAARGSSELSLAHVGAPDPSETARAGRAHDRPWKIKERSVRRRANVGGQGPLGPADRHVAADHRVPRAVGPPQPPRRGEGLARHARR